jgi:hypothetical protein
VLVATQKACSEKATSHAPLAANASVASGRSAAKKGLSIVLGRAWTMANIAKAT